MREHHNGTMTEEDKRAIIERFHGPGGYLDSPYVLGSTSLLPPLPFRNILRGYRCNLCSYSSCTELLIKRHCKARHENATGDSFQACLVQTISDVRGAKYFAVSPREVSEAVHTIEETSSHRLARELMRAVVPKVYLATNAKNLSFFFYKSGWFEKDGTIPFDEETVKSLIKPASSDEELELVDAVKRWFYDIEERIPEIPDNFRYLFGYKLRQMTMIDQLQNESTKRDYSKLICSFVLFLKRLNSFSFEEIDISCLGSLSVNSENFTELIVRILQTDFNLFGRRDPFVFFVKVWTFYPTGSMQSNGNIEKAFTKVYINLKTLLNIFS